MEHMEEKDRLFDRMFPVLMLAVFLTINFLIGYFGSYIWVKSITQEEFEKLSDFAMEFCHSDGVVLIEAPAEGVEIENKYTKIIISQKKHLGKIEVEYINKLLVISQIPGSRVPYAIIWVIIASLLNIIAKFFMKYEIHFGGSKTNNDEDDFY